VSAWCAGWPRPGAAAPLRSIGEIDPLIAASARHWRIERMAVLDRLVLRLAVYELQHGDSPAAVVIDEAIELTRTFSGEEAVAFVNGVLDAVRRRLDGEGAGPVDGDGGRT
jgi:N utilization substance protein B